MKEAFTYMFKDDHFWQKAAIYFVLAFIVAHCNVVSRTHHSASILQLLYLLILLVLYIFANCVTAGYKMSNIYNLQTISEFVEVPSIDYKKDFVTGLRYYIAMLAFLAPFILSAVIIGLVPVLKIISAIIIISLGVYMSVFTMGFNYMFAKENSYTVFYKIKELFSLLSKDPKKYVLSLITAAAVFIAQILAVSAIAFLVMLVLPGMPDMFSTILVAGFGTYVFYVVAYLTAKSIKTEQL